MVFVVHGNLEYNHVGPLDHRIDDLAVDKVDVRHTEEKRQVLAVGVFDVTFDAPIRLFDGNDRIAKHDVIVHRIAMPLVHEAHVDAV